MPLSVKRFGGFLRFSRAVGQERAERAQAGGHARPFVCRVPWLIDQAGERAVLQIELGVFLPWPQNLLLEDRCLRAGRP